MKNNILGILTLVFFIAACGGNEEALIDLDLLPYGMPITIKAPADTVIVSNQDDFLGYSDVVIKSKDTTSSYCLQIYLDKENNNSDLNGILEEMKAEIQADSVNQFIQFVQEDNDAFIYEYQTDNEKGFDFRYVKLIGVTNKYTFQGSFAEENLSLEAVQMMYKLLRKN